MFGVANNPRTCKITEGHSIAMRQVTGANVFLATCKTYERERGSRLSTRPSINGVLYLQNFGASSKRDNAAEAHQGKGDGLWQLHDDLACLLCS